MDFLIPTVSKDFNGLIARPSTPDRALRCPGTAGCNQGPGGSTELALLPSLHPRLRFPVGHSPDTETVPGQLVDGVHAGKAECGGVHLGEGGQPGPLPQHGPRTASQRRPGPSWLGRPGGTSRGLGRTGAAEPRLPTQLLPSEHHTKLGTGWFCSFRATGRHGLCQTAALQDTCPWGP